MDDKRTVGEHIAGLRQTYSIKREVLAERSGLSVELIGRIEDEGYIPDLAPLVKLARALGVRLGTFLDDHEELGPVITRAGMADEGVRFTAGAGSSVAEDGRAPRAGLAFKALAAHKAGWHMEPFTVDVNPDADSALSAHEGEEFLYVLSGTVALEYGADRYELAEGDSAYYDSIVPHRVTAALGKRARMLAVVHTPA